MSALHPNPQATAAVVTIAVPVHAARAVRRRVAAKVRAWFDLDLPPRGAQLAAAGSAFGFAAIAVAFAVAGFAWAALPIAVLAIAILLGAYLPARLGSRYDAQRAAEDAEDAEAGA